MNYDKPRITSTIIVSVFTLINTVFVIASYPVWWSSINIEEDNVAAAGIVALFAGFGMVFLILFYFVALAALAICFPFAIANRKSTLKGIRITSYILDGIIGAAIIATIVKIILLFVGV